MIEDTIKEILLANDDIVELVDDRIFSEDPVKPTKLPHLLFDAQLDKDKSPSPQTGQNGEDCYDVVLHVMTKSRLVYSQIVQIFRQQLDNTNGIRLLRTAINNDPDLPLEYHGGINFSIWGS